MQHIKPKYYTSPNRPDLSVRNVIEAWNLDKNFYLANVIKYILRIEKQNTVGGRIEDLRKAATYIEMAIEGLSTLKKDMLITPHKIDTLIEMVTKLADNYAHLGYTEGHSIYAGINRNDVIQENKQLELEIAALRMEILSE